MLCVWLCRGLFLSVTNIGWTFCVQEMYFVFLLDSLCELFCDIRHLGDGAVQKECKLVWGIQFMCLQTSFRRHENHKNYIDTFLHLKILPWHAWILLCLEMPYRWQFLKKYSHTFVLLCSINCLDQMEIVLFMSCLWDIKGKAPASYQSLLMLTGCQGMGSWQECGCKIDLTCVCVCVRVSVSVEMWK